MELASIEMVLVHSGRVGQYVVGRCDGVLAARHVVAVYEIDGPTFDALRQG